MPRPALGLIQYPIQWVVGGSFPRGKVAPCEDERWHPSCAKVKNWWSFSSAAHVWLHGVRRGVDITKL